MRRFNQPICHECCPAEWRSTPDVTGSYELDGVIARNGNTDIDARLEFYCKGVNDPAYGPLTGYDGYSNYHGDS